MALLIVPRSRLRAWAGIGTCTSTQMSDAMGNLINFIWCILCFLCALGEISVKRNPKNPRDIDIDINSTYAPSVPHVEPISQKRLYHLR